MNCRSPQVLACLLASTIAMDLHDPLATPATSPIRRGTPRVARNAPCPCGSGHKHKQCCGQPAAAPLSPVTEVSQ